MAKILARHKYIYQYWGLALLIFCSFQPFYLWGSFFNSMIPFLVAFIFVVSFKMEKKDTQFLFYLMFLYSWVSLRGGYTFIGILANFCVLTMIGRGVNNLRMIFDCFRKLYAVLILISLIMYILVVVLNISIPYNVIGSLNDGKQSVVYYSYPFLVTYISHGILLPRFCGFFDEPGVVGTISGCLLMTKKYDFKDIYNIPILLSGIFSASLFFIVVTVIYTFIFKKFIYGIMTISIIAVAAFCFVDVEMLETLVYSRINIEGGSLTGDTRTSGLSPSWYESFKATPAYFWGLGNNAHTKYNAGGCSYVDLIIDYGIIFFVLYVFALVVFAWRRIKTLKDFFIYLFLMYGLIYQRPFITFFGYFFLLITPIYLLGLSKETSSCKK